MEMLQPASQTLRACTALQRQSYGSKKLSVQPDPTILELLKIPTQHQTKEIIDKIWARKKELGNFFYDKTQPAKDRNAVFDEYNAICNYLGAKPAQWKHKEPGQGGGYSKRVITIADREKNCNDLKVYLIKSNLWDQLEPTHQALILSNAWGSP